VDLPADLVTRVFQLAQRVSRALRGVRRPDAITHLSDDEVTGRGFNLGAHFKVRLIPRHANDAVRIAWNRPPRPSRARRKQYAGELREA
jgi:diadenosine tetraphosphate (Ap4A) HIT family hydrolase